MTVLATPQASPDGHHDSNLPDAECRQISATTWLITRNGRLNGSIRLRDGRYETSDAEGLTSRTFPDLATATTALSKVNAEPFSYALPHTRRNRRTAPLVTLIAVLATALTALGATNLHLH